MHENMNMHGALTLHLIDEQGQIVHSQHRKNRIVTTGRQLVAELFAGQSGNTAPTKVTTIAVGDSNTPAKDEDTALGTERFRKPIASVQYTGADEPQAGSNQTVRRVRVRLQAELDYEEANNNTTPLQEAGIFTDNGIMYNRVVFEPVKKTKSYKLMLIWEVTF